MLAFLNGVHFKNREEMSPQQKNLIYVATNTPAMIGVFYYL